MIREVIVTSPTGVRLCFEASGEKGLVLQRYTPDSLIVDIRDENEPRDGYSGRLVGVVPTSWLIELNEVAT